MTWQAITAVVLSIVVPQLSSAQWQEIKAPSCLAADSVFGPLTPRQAYMKTPGMYMSSRDSTRMVAGTGNRPNVTATATVLGHTPISIRPPATLRVNVPYYLTERADAGTGSMYAQIDDSAMVSLGPPIIREWLAGSPRPSDFGIRDMSIDLKITAEKFLQVAQARTFVISWFGSKTKASDDELTAINALYRTLLCVRAP